MSSGPLSLLYKLGEHMYRYKSKCRWNMLLYIDGEVIEIRPGELFKSKNLINSRYLDVIDKPKAPKKKAGRPKKTYPTKLFEDEVNATSST